MAAHLLVYLATAALLLLIYLAPKIYRRWRFCRTLDRIPGPRAFPIIGTTWMFMGVGRDQLHAQMRRHMRPFEGIARVWMGSRGSVVFKRAEHMELILSAAAGSAGVADKKNWQYTFVKPWLGDGLLTADSTPAWHAHRRIITPAFHFGILEGFCEVFAEQSAVLVERLRSIADTGAATPVYPLLSLATLEMIAEAAMGTRLGVQNEEAGGGETRRYVDSVYEATTLIVWRGMRPWLHADWIYARTAAGRRFEECRRTMHAFTGGVIERRRAARLAEVAEAAKAENQLDDTDAVDRRKPRLAFLDLLLENAQLSDQELREEVDTFMFAGHDTTTASIGWTVWLLANHPEWQEQLYAEQVELGEGHSSQHLNSMKVLDRVVKEALRLYPSAPIIGRQMTETIWADGYEIPAGTELELHLYELHRDERWFADAEKFDPDRWLPERSVGRHAFAYVPFSAGARNCVGQKFAMLEEKAVLAALVRAFRFGVPEGTLVEDEPQMLEVTVKPGRGVPVEVYAR